MAVLTDVCEETPSETMEESLRTGLWWEKLLGRDEPKGISCGSKQGKFSKWKILSHFSEPTENECSASAKDLPTGEVT